MTASIELDNVSLAFSSHRFGVPRFWALQEVSFNVEPGETLGIVGRNGAGKTTLLQLMAGIIAPSAGQVIKNVPHISLLSLNAGLQPNLSGRDNAIMGGLLLGLRISEVRAKLADIREFSGLGDFFDRPVSTYSTGMRARLGFATAIHVEPDVLLLDEVLAVGDQAFREQALEAMNKTISSRQTVVMASHSNPILRQLCDRVAWIDQSRLKLIGPTDTVLDAYIATPAEEGA